MDLIYCAKCQTHTDTQDVRIEYTRTNRPMKNGVCVVCGTRKNTFIKIRKREDAAHVSESYST